jgi:hypothetical protein
MAESNSPSGSLIPPEARDSWYSQITICFSDGKQYRIPIELSASGTHLPAIKEKSPPWVELGYHKCPCCPLPPSHRTCPAAASMDATLSPLLTRRSFEKVTAIAEDGAGRRTIAEMPLQAVGAVLVQVAVMSSGCPVGHFFRPLVHDLRPFATQRELLRHLLRHVLLQQRGEVSGLRRELHRLLDPLHVVLSHLWRRISEAGTSGGDAVANSLVRLDAFTGSIPLSVRNWVVSFRRTR